MYTINTLTKLLNFQKDLKQKTYSHAFFLWIKFLYTKE